MASGFSGFTADQWKNWVIYYSLFSLKGLLPQENYDAWVCFVTACCLICRRSLTVEQCLTAEAKIIEFCKHFEKLYGPEFCTQNMHSSCHLVDCIRDYGPVYSFGVSPSKDIMEYWGHITKTTITLVSWYLVWFREISVTAVAGTLLEFIFH